MATVATRAAIDLSHVTEVLELAETILMRTRDHAFIQKVTILRGYLEMYRMFPEKDYGEHMNVRLHKRIECGFTLMETMVAAAIFIVLAALAAPSYVNVRNSLRISGDIHSIAGLTAEAKLRAASGFTRARVYANLSSNTFELQVWNKANGCWVADSDQPNTCLTYTSGAPSGSVVNLSQGDTFGFGALTSGPTPGQTTIGQAAQCLDNSGSAISNTACVVFNSRGIPINPTTLAPVATGAFYVTNGIVVDGVTVSATGSLQIWSTGANASQPTWYAQ